MSNPSWPFDSVLVANRGEIAVRVIRSARDAGLRTVAVYADPDEGMPHTRLADEAYPLHGSSPADSYLSIDKLIDVALASGAQAVHPGYGFLSENAAFAEAVVAAGLTWIGPAPETIRALGDKVSARAIATRVGAPLAPGTEDPVAGPEEIEAFVAEHGLPIAIKAAHGGGGRGLRVVTSADRIAPEFESATREAVAAFGRGECFVERYLERPRHVEAQVLADSHGTVVIVGTRDCSLQRRYQKLVEEAPAPFLSAEQEQSIRDAARDICREAGYVGAGTVEFLVAADGLVSFLEVNTRLQVEHTVSEVTTGTDLVLEQFRIAAGERLSFADDPVPSGHAFEFRINAEDPRAGFIPSPGELTRWAPPSGPGIRVDSGVEQGTVIGGLYDSLLAKLVVWGPDRASALARSRRALDEFVVEGVPTVLAFDRAVCRDPAFTAVDGRFQVHTTWIGSADAGDLGLTGADRPAVDEPTDVVAIRIGNRALPVHLPGLSRLGPRADAIRAESQQVVVALGSATVSGDAVTAPMQGTIAKVVVQEGQLVEAGELLAVIEAMKMENPIRAHRSGRVEGLGITVGETRAGGQVICRITDADDD